MKWRICLLVLVCSAGPAFSCAVGDTYDQVISEKGKPVSHVEGGVMQILSYPDATVKLKDNIVVSIKGPEPVHKAAGAAPPPAPAPAIAQHTAPPADEPPSRLAWTTDYRSALEQAKSEHKHVFLFFTGSDWCGWCKKLNREILRTEAFERYAEGNLILVELDYPRAKPQPYEVKVQNHMLEGRFNITGYPTVVVLNSAGRSVARMGYQDGGPGPFIAQIQALGD